jgi:hypothetical protein
LSRFAALPRLAAAAAGEINCGGSGAGEADPDVFARGGSVVSSGKLVASMLGLVAIGAPMVYFIWEFVNELLAARATVGGFLVVLPIVLAFLAYLVFVSRAVRRWTGVDTDGA